METPLRVMPPKPGRATGQEPDDVLELAARPLLRALREATGLDTTYLTRVLLQEDVQRVLYAHRRDDPDGIEVPEGIEVPWEDTLCRRALDSGQACTTDVPSVWGDSDAARDLGIVTYVSAPVRLADGQLWGTLCGAAGTARELDDHGRRLLGVFADMLADRVDAEIDRRQQMRRAAELEHLLDTRALVTAEIQHKMKGPLTAGLGWLHLVATRCRVDDDAEEWIGHARASFTELQQRIDGLLEATRTQSAGRRDAPGVVELDTAVRDSLERLEGLAHRHVLITRLSHARAHAVAGSVTVVLEHLVENATKYAPEGSTITVTVRSTDGRPTLVVDDEGPGLPEGVDVFAPFSRGDESTRGSGLGLHIVRTMVEDAGGTIATDDSPAGGARFVVTWPSVPSGHVPRD